MALTLTPTDLARVAAANRALLSPLGAPDPDAWRAEAMRTVADALGAETATFVLPGRPEPILMHGKDRSTVSSVRHYIGSAWLGEGPGPVPAVDMFKQLAVQRRLEVWDMYSADTILGGGGAGLRHEYALEVLAPEHMMDTNSLFVPQARGVAHLALHTFRRRPDPGEHLPLLSVLLPAFKAGLDALGRLADGRAALDVIAEPLAAFDADGREIHRNGALVRVLAADPERERVEGALRLLARGLRPLAAPRDSEGTPVPASVGREVQTGRGRYALRGALVGPGAFGGAAALLVSVEPPGGPALPTSEQVRARHGLTKREAEVALLLAEGLSNEALSERLFVSKHTARHHVEAVLSKLDVPGRAAVAARLLQPA